MSRRESIFAALALCASIIAIQISWLIVIPPFGGMDEFDHAYRAMSVAHGHIVEDAPKAPHGYGDLIPVPADIPEAAHHACVLLSYTKHDNCNPVTAPNRRGEVLIASSAAKYDPAYYAVVGTVARPFHGASALYAMRLATVALSDLFLFAALVTAICRAKTLWPTAGVLVTFTPVLVEATTIAAPNGVELAGALAMWAGALAYIYGRREATDRRRLLWLSAISGATVALTHTTGPLWVMCFVCAAAILLGQSGLRSSAKHHLGAIVGSGLILAVAIGGAIGWTVWQGTNNPSSMPVAMNRRPTPAEIVEQAFLWVLQSIGGVPFRDQPSPAAVFAIAFCLFLVLIALATAKGTARQRAVASALTCIAFAVPIVLTIATFSRLGFSWQGRYTLPLTVGLPLLAGWALEPHRPVRRLARPWCFMTLIGVVAIQVVAIWHVRGLESGKWPNGRWTHFASSTSALILLGAAALALATLAVLTTKHSALDTPRNLTLTPPREPART